MYAFTEHFVLPLSHDEVVHGKGSLLGKMPGDDWQQFANLRLLYGIMWTQPGKKLLFMGGELAPWTEWNHDATLDWSLLDNPRHASVRLSVTALNDLYRPSRRCTAVTATRPGSMDRRRRRRAQHLRLATPRPDASRPPVTERRQRHPGQDTTTA